MRLLLLLALLGPARSQEGSTWTEDPHRSLEEARIEERSILDRLHEIDQQLSTLRHDEEQLRARQETLEAQRVRHEDEATSAAAIASRQQVRVAQRLDALYRLHRKGLARVVFGAEDPVDLRRRSAYLRAIADTEVARLGEYTTVLEHKRAAARALDEDLRAQQALQAELHAKQLELAEQRSRRVALLDDVRSRRELALQSIAEMTGARKDLGERLTTWSAPPSASPTPNQASFRGMHGKLPWPTSGRILHRFGSYTDPRTGERVQSKGVDIAADYGTPVRAVFGGVVALADYVRGYGQTVAVKHGDYTTVYAHLNGVRVRKGEAVLAGHVLGLVGNTGLTDGAGYMLTFELRYNQTAQDPLSWLGAR